MAHKKVYTDNESELVICSKPDGNFIFSINAVDWMNDPSNFDLELTREDVIELINDLQYYLDTQNELPKFKGISEEKVRNAKGWTGNAEIDKGNDELAQIFSKVLNPNKKINKK